MPLVLGPQYPHPNLPEVLADVGDGRVVTIPAGWRMEESEVGPLRHAIRRDVAVLPLYAWFDELSSGAPRFAARYRARQDRAQRLSELYRLRLRHGLVAVRALRALRNGDPEVLDAEVERAIDHVRRLDRELLARHEELDAEFSDVARAWEQPEVVERHAEARELIEGAAAVLVPGGHVAILANRMHTFGLGPLLSEAVHRGTPVVAWSGGAMALAERVVLFYDDPPEGPGDPEVLGPGLGLLRGTVWFPHAVRRLRLDDPERVSENALRFAPDRCITLDNGAWLRVEGRGVEPLGDPYAALTFTPAGAVEPL